MYLKQVLKSLLTGFYSELNLIDDKRYFLAPLYGGVGLGPCFVLQCMVEVGALNGTSLYGWERDPCMVPRCKQTDPW